MMCSKVSGTSKAGGEVSSLVHCSQAGPEPVSGIGSVHDELYCGIVFPGGGMRLMSC